MAVTVTDYSGSTTSDIAPKLPIGNHFITWKTPADRRLVLLPEIPISSTTAGGGFDISIGEDNLRHVRVVESEHAIFYYGNPGGQCCVIKMSDGSELLYTFLRLYPENEWGSKLTDISDRLKGSNYLNPTSAFDVRNPDGYVAFAPYIYSSATCGKIGADAGEVFLQSGIPEDPTTMGPNGVSIRGHKYYVCGCFCVRAD